MKKNFKQKAKDGKIIFQLHLNIKIKTFWLTAVACSVVQEPTLMK